MASIFKAYDIRGKYPAEINEEIAFKIGRATATYLKAKKMLVGRDGRVSSDSLAEKLIEGIISTGCNVISIGQSTTPLFYFSINTTQVDGGIMVTASHNPPEYNGCKLMGPDGIPIDHQSGLNEIEKLMDAEGPEKEKGSITLENYLDDYVNLLIELSGADKEDLGRLRIVVDASNGMTGLVLENLFKKINVSVVSTFFEIDGRFPNHGPDISKTENLELLQKKVLAADAALGVAFDPDGDRIFIVDNNGVIVWPDYILGLLFEYLGQPKTVYDTRTSRSIKELIGSKGIMSQVGRTNIRRLMRENDAALGGELSGHMFFKEMKYNESAVLAMLYILVILNRFGKQFTKLIEPLIKYSHSGDISIPLKGNPQEIFTKIKAKYSDGKLSEFDGVTIEYPDWWFNVRASNTEPVLRVVVEAVDKETRDQKLNELLSLIDSSSH